GKIEEAEADLWERFGTECAVLVLDSTGFVRATRARGIVHFLDLFLRMREVVTPVLERHRCLAWRSSADNLFAEFAAADQALKAATAAHRAVEKAGLMLDEDEPYRVCIGIGFGRVLKGGAMGMFGGEMNLASKLGEDIAGGGETLLTENAYEHLRRRRSAEFEKRKSTVSGNAITYYAARR
ncbi:MAG: nucleotidyl cyclase domain-containing protein, partial [Planctomycetota bacterium]